ncbi:MAG: AMP-binding protein [Pyramidobacter sp.]|jgi:long-chain acyl-CoA synthetase
MKNSVDYLSLIQSIPAHRTALIEDGRVYTYGALADEARRLRSLSPEPAGPSVAWIRAATVYDQLVRFLALSGTSRVPVVVPADMKGVPEFHATGDVPAGACMGVLTSGSTGQPKLWFRTLESWASFFPVQNEIFGMTARTRLFAQGSLAFTGNLNLYLSLLSLGASVITVSRVNPSAWRREMELHHADALYLIPCKLRLLAKYAAHSNPDVKTILAGSESLGRRDLASLKAAYPNSRCFLYYGASELSYVTWLTDEEMNDNPACVGRPFPGVDVTLRNGEIYVDTPYSAMGITGPYSVGDTGFMDCNGYLYFTGRKDNVFNIHGRKVSSAKVENALNALPQIQEAAVVFQNGALRAHVLLSEPDRSVQNAAALRRSIKRALSDDLESWEIPREILFHEKLPKNDSGKTVRKRLSDVTASGISTELQ